MTSNTPALRFKGFTDVWEQRKFSELAETRRGLTYKPSDIRQDEVRVLRSSNIDEDTFVKSEDDVFVDRSAINIPFARSGDILITSANGSSRLVGKHAIIYGIPDNSTVHGGFMLLASAKNPQFVNALMGAPWYTKFINLYVAGGNGAIGNLNKNDLDEQSVLVPSESEQEKIGQFLENLDNLITLHQHRLDKLKSIKKSMLEKMFPREGEDVPKIRFKGFADAWEQRKFSTVFDGLQNNTLSRAELNYESGTVQNVHYGDVLIKFGDYIDASKTELPYISDDTKAEKFKSSFLQDGDIIIADTAEDDTVGKCTEIQGSEGLRLLSGLHTIACRPKGKYGPMFLGYYINSPAYHNQLKPLMQGMKVTSISKSALQDTNLMMLKSVDEQTKIGEYFSNLDNLITLHQRELEKLHILKKVLQEGMFV